MPEINLVDVATYYKGLPHQKEALQLLQQSMPDSLLQKKASWYQKWSEKPEVTTENPLDVPYQSQRDNLSGTGYRECFSSSCAMVAMYWGKVNSDDEYNLIRQKYGDSTDAQAQLRALRSLGLNAEFRTNGDVDALKEQIDKGRPSPVGWLHHGSGHGTGGGHYAVIIGYDASGWWVNDPYGDADLVNGGYPGSTNGKKLHYSYGNWNPRWMVDGPGTGWFVDIWA